MRLRTREAVVQRLAVEAIVVRASRTAPASRRTARPPSRCSWGPRRPGRSGCRRAAGGCSTSAACRVRSHTAPSSPDPTAAAAATGSAGPSLVTGPSRAQMSRRIPMYSRIRASGLANGWPYQPSTTCGPETPRPRITRPAAEVVQGHRRHRGGRRGAGGDLDDRRAQLDPLGRRPPPGQRHQRVGPVGLGGPDRVKAQALGLEDALGGPGRRAAGPVAGVQAQSKFACHARDPIRCSRSSRARTRGQQPRRPGLGALPFVAGRAGGPALRAASTHSEWA